jgi:hypothetical protein
MRMTEGVEGSVEKLLATLRAGVRLGRAVDYIARLQARLPVAFSSKCGINDDMSNSRSDLCAFLRVVGDTPLVEAVAFLWLARDTPFGRNCYIFAEGEFLRQRAQ